MAEPQKTGIKNADELITLATAYGLTVTVEETDRETLTSYVVRFAIPVPVDYAGTELGRTITGDTLTLLWTKSHRKGARGCLEDATRWTTTDHRKLRTLRAVTAAVETLGHDAKQHARDTAPLPDAVVDAPHALYINGELRKENIPAERVRTFVKNRRFNGLLTHQDADGGIVCDNRRYVPVTAKPVPLTPQSAETPAPRWHARSVNGGEPQIVVSRAAMAEINHAMMGGKKDVREMSAWQSSARITYKDPARGTVDLRPATAEEIETNSERIRVAEARRAYLEGGRLEEQQLHTNREIEARARRILTDALHPEDRIAFITSRQGAFLRGVTDGSDWPLLTDAFALLLEDHGWYAEPCSRGLRLTPPADQAGDIVLAGQACVRDAAHTEALEVERLLSGAETWERKHSVFSRPWTVKTVTRNSAAGTVAWAREQGWDTCRTENGELSMESPTGEASYVLRPVADAAPAPVDEKTRRWAEGFAAKWWAEQHTGEPTDDALTAVFAHTVKPPKPEAYPLIREAITALTPPAAAAPLFAAHAAREAVDEAVDLAPSSLHRLVNHLETMPLAAPPALHERLRAARDTAESAWEALRVADSLPAKNAARSAAQDARVQARAAILAVQPHASRMHGTDMPHTTDSIRAAALAYIHLEATPDETDAIKSGTAEIRVDCRPDTGTGLMVTARITAGIRDVGWFLPAHPPIVVKFRRVDGRESPADNARKVLGATLRVDVPVKYKNPARR